MSTYTDTLRALADFIDTADYNTLDGHSEGLRFTVDHGGVSIHLPYSFSDAEHKKAVRKVMRAIGGKWDKNYSGASIYFEQEESRIAGASVTVFAKRDAVCERKVVGTETVEHEAREAYTETREIVEWDCGTLLGDAPATPALDAELESLIAAERASA